MTPPTSTLSARLRVDICMALFALLRAIHSCWILPAARSALSRCSGVMGGGSGGMAWPAKSCKCKQ
jgi:hypothetical protein